MLHNMKLQRAPYEAIASGTKTVEMRLNDEKRRGIRVGDIIEFENIENGARLKTRVTDIAVYKDFSELYAHYDKRSLGYGESETPDHNDMRKYYTDGQIARYGVMAIVLCLE